MGKIATKMTSLQPRRRLTKAEIWAMVRRSKKASKDFPCAKTAWYDAKAQIIFITLDNPNHGVIGLPRTAFPILAKLKPSEIAAMETGGLSLWWPAIDDGADVSWMIEKALTPAGLQTLAAYIRGLNRSIKKVEAARRNGRKGGRPRKKAA